MHSFRNLQIFEADANLAIKILLAKRTRAKAEQRGYPEEQWGGRKGRSATDLGIDKSLIIEYGLLSSTNIGIIELDAQACFDRMIKSIS